MLHNFLGTFTSRHSDYQGYSLFGQLPPDFEAIAVDLLGLPPVDPAPLSFLQRLAIQRFSEQVLASGLDRSVVGEALLEVTRGSQPVLGRHGESKSMGCNFSFTVRVVMDNGRSHRQQRNVFVAAHDPDKERRRHPDHWGL